jgi:hypothetical protein
MPVTRLNSVVFRADHRPAIARQHLEVDAAHGAQAPEAFA